MKIDPNEALAHQVVAMRLAQMQINEWYKNKKFEIPIHLALGHEAIAVAVSEAMSATDRLVCSHRNVHYHLARGASLPKLLAEYTLEPMGIASGKQGSMNLTNPAMGIAYTSSILGNNFGVGAGIALANKAKKLANKAEKADAVTFIVTGDGAMEEGSFYETLLFFAAQKLSGVIIVENNGWSLGSAIDERRAPIDVKSVAEGTGAVYAMFEGNNVFEYAAAMQELRDRAARQHCAIVVEVMLNTLGDWRLKTDEYPDGKFINYHAGPAPTISWSAWPVIQDNMYDPVAVLTTLMPIERLKKMASEISSQLMGASA